jgi:hypothetical protein
MTTSTESSRPIPLQVVINPLWRVLPYLPKDARALCQHEEWYAKRYPKARKWAWADELYRVLDLVHDGDLHDFYADLLNASVLLPVSPFRKKPLTT